MKISRIISLCLFIILPLFSSCKDSIENEQDFDNLNTLLEKQFTVDDMSKYSNHTVDGGTVYEYSFEGKTLYLIKRYYAEGSSAHDITLLTKFNKKASIIAYFPLIIEETQLVQESGHIKVFAFQKGKKELLMSFSVLMLGGV
jgi:hypothetical protein